MAALKKIKRKLQENHTLRILSLLAIVILAVALFALPPKIFSAHDMLYQTIAVVLSVVFTAIITDTLLSGQSDKEETRERNIKVYQNKLTVYANFISKMWAITNDNKVEPDEIIALRSEVFNKLIFYLDDFQIMAISKEMEKLDKDSTIDQYVSVFENITKILRSSILGLEKDESKTEIKTLWGRFNSLLPNNSSQDPEPEQKQEPEQESELQPENPLPEISETSDKRIHRNCVHFNIFDNKWQKNIFSNGVNALGLCEYGEVWRTNLIKRCKKNEIVFLYKTGGPGYVGAFLAKGWVVFEADGSGNLEKVVKFEYEKDMEAQVISSEEEKTSYVERFCAEDLLDDGSTRVSYLLVEPLVYFAGGVGVISVYRRTISAYDSKYAWRTLGRFKTLIETRPEKQNKYKFNDEEMTLNANTQALQQIFAENNVLSSDWDDNVGDWKDKDKIDNN